MNYYLSIGPLLGAMRAGSVPPVVILPPADGNASHYCTSAASCPFQAHIQAWDQFFTYIAGVKTCNNESVDAALGVMWQAHTTSIHTGLSLFKNLVRATKN